jgi:hypothetical protein
MFDNENECKKEAFRQIFENLNVVEFRPYTGGRESVFL